MLLLVPELKVIVISVIQTQDILEIIFYLPVDARMDTLMMEFRSFVYVKYFMFYRLQPLMSNMLNLGRQLSSL